MNDQAEIDTGNALVVATRPSLTFYFEGDEMDALLYQIEAKVRSHAPDLTSVKGRKAIASLAYKVSQTKTALDSAGKAMNEKARAEIEAVDAQRRKVRERLDALRDEARKPLVEWEAAEEKRLQSLQHRIDLLDRTVGHDSQAADIKLDLDRIASIPINDTWDEREDEARTKKETVLAELQVMHQAAVTREEQEAELARYRAAEQERLEKERQEQEERERAEAARLAAEHAEQERIAREKAEAEEAARIEREKAEVAERAAEEARMAAEREAKEAEERHQRDLAESKAREEAAAQAERDRIASEKAAEDAAREKRERDEAHRAQILADINDALSPIPREQIGQALMDGRIPHVEVLL